MISAVPAPSLQAKVPALRRELERERQKNFELEDICRDLNQDNDRYLDVALQLEKAVEKLLVALSLPTNALYQTDVTNYHAPLTLIDNETPRLRTLMSGLNLLASLAVGLNSSIEMHKGEIRSLQEDVSRLECKKPSIEYGDTVLHRRPHSSLMTLSNEDCHTATCVNNFDEPTTPGTNQNPVSAADEGFPVVVLVTSNQTLSETERDSQLSEKQKAPDMSEDPQRINGGVAKAAGGQERALRNSNQRDPAPFNISGSITNPDTLYCGYECAISVDGHRLAGDPFNNQTGWQIYFDSYAGLENPHITLLFRLTRARFGRPGNVQVVKAFKLEWQLSLEGSFHVREVKTYKPTSLENLPLSLTKLCADKCVRGTLWLISLVGMFDSPPDYSRRVLKGLDENAKVNLKALFTPRCAKRVDIWVVNPKDDDRRNRKLDMDALISLQSLH